MMSRMALAGFLLCLISGCHSYPYCNNCSPSTVYPMSPAYPQQPPSTMIVPNTTQQSYAPTYTPGTAPANVGGEAPPYQPPPNTGNPGGNGGTGGGDLPPNYDQDPLPEADPGFGDQGALDRSGDVEIGQIDDSDAGNDEFLEPISVQSTSGAGLADPEPPANGAAAPSPYLWDNDKDDFNGDGIPETYEWLRGIVDFDEKRRIWRITYNANPADQSDKYGGTFTLSNDQSLYDLGLVPDDVVLIDGQVDIEKPDYAGKPTYRVDHVKRLEPIK